MTYQGLPLSPASGPQENHPRGKCIVYFEYLKFGLDWTAYIKIIAEISRKRTQ
jgi:hypothetical protein